MEKFLKYWWVYILLYFLFIAIIMIESLKDIFKGWFENILFLGLLLAAIAQLVVWIIALKKKREPLSSFILLGGLASIVGLFFLIFWLSVTPGINDDFGKQHPIPADLVCFEPQESFNAEDVDSLDATSWLRIRDGSQGGIYDYVYFSTVLPAGYIFLKCYEATDNVVLSDERIQQETKAPVNNHLRFGPIGGSRKFTIYEGSWGDFYAVRVEVWFYDEATGKERMLNKKIYKMQGWQR